MFSDSNDTLKITVQFIRCSGMNGCEGYQYRGTGAGNSPLIRTNPGGNTILSSEDSLIYIKGISISIVKEKEVLRQLITRQNTHSMQVHTHTPECLQCKNNQNIDPVSLDAQRSGGRERNSVRFVC